ncbi:MAG: methionyl-tRNA formyltransferase [Chlorobia bacterium]|nr:methionyl-tRNA formyltransferase [Fimbriimonadaceae bacterium]
MRLVFFGTGSFCLPALSVLREHVVLVVTQPDRPSGRGMKMHASPAKVSALEMGIFVATPEKSRAPEFVEELESLRADALVVASYGQILSQRVLDSAIRGGINLHGSILPKYRGAAPIQRAIENQEHETGVTLMQMDKGMDTGDIIEIRRTPIGANETYGELQDRLAEVAAELVADWMPRIVLGDYVRIPQNSEYASLAPKIEKNECGLDVRQSATVAYARFRAFSPAPGAFLSTRRGILKIALARLGTGSGSPGVVLSTVEGLEIAFGEASLILQEIQPEGKKRMSGKDFANGMRLKPGDLIA